MNEGRPEPFEAWLDGSLADAEREAFERRLAADPSLAEELARQRRLDAWLQRTFHVPENPGGGLVVPPPAPSTRWGALAPAAWVLAAAAGLLVAFLVGSRTRPADPPVVTDGGAERVAAGGGLTRVPPPSACTPGEVLAPDVAALYERIAGVAVPEASCKTETPAESGDDLERALAARWGDELALGPGGDDALYGPHEAEEWPTGTVLSGYPDGTAALPAVLVAEDEACLKCCLHVVAPEGSGLRLFTWRVGDVLLTEITPHGEPRLLQYFKTSR